MKKILFTMLAVLLGTAGRVHADHEIVVLRSSSLKPYGQALHGFRDVIGTGIPQRLKSIQYADITEFILTEEPDQAELRTKVTAGKPDLILAVGTNAFAFFRNVYDIPIVYLMVPFPQGIIKGHDNITGINMDISPARQLGAFIEIVPGLKRLGLVYNPQRSNDLVNKIQTVAKARHINLIAQAAADSKDVPGLLNGMIGKIDGFWMLPDLIVTTPQTLESMLIFSLENRIPILTFSEKYLVRGATVAVTFDSRAMGEQAGKMAQKILSGTDIGKMMPSAPQKVKAVVNQKVAEKLGIIINHNAAAIR